MARHKDSDWSLPEGTPNGKDGTNHGWEAIHTAVLMDIRNEMKKLNSVFACRNAQMIPALLRGIARNTTKNKRKARG
jgi:hypothetical protein